MTNNQNTFLIICYIFNFKNIQTSIFKCMEKFLSTIFIYFMKYILKFIKFWFNGFIFLNNFNFVEYATHLLKKYS